MDSSILFAAEIDPSCPTIDLHHTSNIQQALDTMERELFVFAQRGEEYCRVIHGIGEGKLMKAVHEALEKNPMVYQFQKEDHGGSTIVVF